MPIMRSRARLVTFRVDEKEFQALREATIRTGARSMSEFARHAILARVGLPGSPLDGDLVTLTTRLNELDRLLAPVAESLGKILGRTPAAPTTYAILDTVDNVLMGNKDGPLIYNESGLARVVAEVIGVRLTQPVDRYRAIPLSPEKAATYRLRDSVETTRSVEEALRLLEEGLV